MDKIQEAEKFLNDYSVALGNLPTYDISKTNLYEAVNYLLSHDFEKLVNILYRIDLSESKLKLSLKNNPETDAAIIIAELLMERQAEKVKSRKKYGSGNKLGAGEW